MYFDNIYAVSQTDYQICKVEIAKFWQNSGFDEGDVNIS